MTVDNRVALMQFLDDERIPPDNGAVERLHVRAALTRKNYLFAGSDAGGDRAAVAYTILGSCRLAGVNPYEYLADVLPRLARSVRLIDIAQFMAVAKPDPEGGESRMPSGHRPPAPGRTDTDAPAHLTTRRRAQ